METPKQKRTNIKKRFKFDQKSIVSIVYCCGPHNLTRYAFDHVSHHIQEHLYAHLYEHVYEHLYKLCPRTYLRAPVRTSFRSLICSSWWKVVRKNSCAVDRKVAREGVRQRGWSCFVFFLCFYILIVFIISTLHIHIYIYIYMAPRWHQKTIAPRALKQNNKNMF